MVQIKTSDNKETLLSRDLVPEEKLGERTFKRPANLMSVHETVSDCYYRTISALIFEAILIIKLNFTLKINNCMNLNVQ